MPQENEVKVQALSKGILSHYSKQDLLNMRSKGMSNAEIAQATGANPTMVIRAIGIQPTAAERLQLWYNSHPDKAEPKKVIANSESKLPLPTVTKVTPTNNVESINMNLNGFEFNVNLKESEIWILDAAHSSIKVTIADLDKFTESLFNVSSMLDKLKKIL